MFESKVDGSNIDLNSGRVRCNAPGSSPEPTLNRLVAPVPIHCAAGALGRVHVGEGLVRPWSAKAWLISRLLNSASVICRFALPWRTPGGTVASIAPLPRVSVVLPHDRSGWAVWAAAC